MLLDHVRSVKLSRLVSLSRTQTGNDWKQSHHTLLQYATLNGRVEGSKYVTVNFGSVAAVREAELE